MAIVTDIITNSETLAAAQLSGWVQLVHRWDIESETSRTAYQAYGVRPLGAISVPTVFRTWAVDHSFELILCNTVARAQDDEIETVLGTIYDKFDSIFDSYAQTKINLVNTVLQVKEPSFSEPEFFAGRKFIVVRMGYVVQYRSSYN